MVAAKKRELAHCDVVDRLERTELLWRRLVPVERPEGVYVDGGWFTVSSAAAASLGEIVGSYNKG